LPSSVDHRAGVVVKPRRAPLEKRRDNRHFVLARYFGKRLGRRARNRLGQVEKLGVFLAAEVFAEKQFVHADDLRAALRGLADLFAGLRKIVGSTLRTAHLNQSDN
jgi:hypothetical protein